MQVPVVGYLTLLLHNASKGDWKSWRLTSTILGVGPRINLLLYVHSTGCNKAKLIISRISQMITQEDALTSINLAMAATRDSSSMKVIAIITMAFLPGTFLAALFAVPSLDWNSQTVARGNFWVYWAFAIPFTIMVFIF